MSKRLSYTRGMLAAPNPDGELVFTASAEGVNRYGFSLNRKRWKIDNFNANPVILWMHNDMMPPIGRGRASMDGSGLRTSITFDRSDPFAVQIENKYRGGFLNAVSVGFDFVASDGRPIERWWSLTPEQIQNESFYDLAEVSAVPVPADPGALIRQRHALAYDFGLFAPDTEEEAKEVLAGRMTLNRQKITPEYPPGSSPLELEVHRLARIVSELTAIPSHNTAVTDTEWDGPAAVSAMPNEAATLRYTHAWRDSEGDADAKSSYKFPHHVTNGGPANLPAVRNALARLSNADIPEADRAGVERHLRNHLEAGQTENDFNPDVIASFLNHIKL